MRCTVYRICVCVCEGVDVFCVEISLFIRNTLPSLMSVVCLGSAARWVPCCCLFVCCRQKGGVWVRTVLPRETYSTLLYALTNTRTAPSGAEQAFTLACKASSCCTQMHSFPEQIPHPRGPHNFYFSGEGEAARQKTDHSPFVFHQRDPEPSRTED